MSRMPRYQATGNQAQPTQNRWSEDAPHLAQQTRKKPTRKAYEQMTDERRDSRREYWQQTERSMRVDDKVDTIRMKPIDLRRDTGRIGAQDTRRNAMTNTQINRAAKQEVKANKLNKALMYMTIALLMTLLFVQIGRLAQISGQTKQIAQLSNAIRELGNERSNLEVRLSMQQNINRVRDEAINKHGMVRPDNGQIRVVALGQAATVRMQTADMSGATSATE